MHPVTQVSQVIAKRVAAPPKRARDDGLPPGPGSHPALQMLGFLLQPTPFLRACREEYGSCLTIRVPGTPPIVQFSDPQAIKEVFAASGEQMHAGEANSILEPFLGRYSVLVLDRELHREQRRLLLPPFRGDRMRAYGDVMRDVTLEHMRRFPRGSTFRIQPHTQAITLDVILRTVFGIDEEAEMSAMRDLLVSGLRIIDNPLLVIRTFQRDLGPRSPWGRFKRIRKEGYVRTKALIAERRAEGNLEERNDILSMLMLATHEDGRPMSDEEIHDELLTLLVAGHETTATALSWAFHRLTLHGDHLARIQGEIDGAFPDGRIEPERIGELTFLDAFIKESLRYHPVIPGVGRVLKEPTEIAGRELPAEVVIGCSILLAHFDPDTWERPERFDPTRFLDFRPKPYTYFPFGGGIRRCIGEAFALYEMRIVLATILAELEPVAAPFAFVRPVRRNITLTPSRGLPIRFRSR